MLATADGPLPLARPRHMHQSATPALSIDDEKVLQDSDWNHGPKAVHLQPIVDFG